jgi:hypothetical protein
VVFVGSPSKLDRANRQQSREQTLADMFVIMPRTSNVAWFGTRVETLELFAAIWHKLGFTRKSFWTVRRCLALLLWARSAGFNRSKF